MSQVQAKPHTRPDAETDPLERALAELAHADVAALRLTGTGQADLVDILLGLIDETVLPRRMAILSGGVTLGDLTIAQRRLTAISLAGSADQNFFKPPSDPDFAARHYAMCIRTMAALLGEDPFRVEITACENSSDMVSCSGQRLAEVLKPKGQNGRLSAFLQDVQGRSLAWLLQEKGSPDAVISGDERISQLLVEFAGMQQAELRGCRYDVPVLPGQYSCTVLSLNDTINVLWVCEGQSSALVAMTVEHSQTTLQQLSNWMANPA